MKKPISLFLSIFITVLGFSQTTYNDIAPALYQNCTSCHRVGGGAPFSMLSYNDISPWASAMETALLNGDMPPWGADTAYIHFVNERPISQADKDTILAWINGGALQGNPALLPPAPVYPQYLLNGTPDTIIQMTTFYSNAGASDTYNTIVVPLALSQSRFIRAIELVPADPSLIHHSIIIADTLGDIPIDTSGFSYSIAGDIAIGAWAPGSMPIVYPNSPQLKMGIEIPANGEIAMQIHTPAGTLGQAINIEFRLYFYPINEPGIRPVYDYVPLQYWENDFWIGAGTIKSFSVEEPALPFDISIFSSFPHSHQICTEILNYAYDTITFDTVPLIKIDKWDFEHQEYYYYQNLVKIPTGYKFHSDHTFDNTALNPDNPNSPPQLISVGLFTDDEMIFDGFQFIVYQPGDELINVDSILKNDPLLNYPVSINEFYTSLESKSYVHPNPLVDKSYIYFNAKQNELKSYSLKICDIKGQFVNMTYEIKDGYFEIYKGRLSPSIYFIKYLMAIKKYRPVKSLYNKR
ncbi:MAG: cytochrome c [Flavobacteriales bacterium]|nr:cytochrome c [Flavobacteriales bacterium]